VYHEKLRIDQFDKTQTGVPEATEVDYRLAFVEFDDHGRMFDAAQLDRAVDVIARARAVPGRKPPVVAVFVHGWKNNASDGSGNVWGFRQVLGGLALQYPQQDIVGIYIGWRGATISAPILKEFTVFDRHHASQRIPKPVIVEAIQRIMKTAKTGERGGDPAPATIVLIGHSFGGAVLEAAVTPTVLSSIDDARTASRPTVTWPADLIMFLNEAQEAERSYPLIERMRNELEDRNPCVAPAAGTPRNQRPAILSISSVGDVATRAFFPGEQLIARPFQRRHYAGADPYGVGGARVYYSTTAHISTFRSHVFGRFDDPDVAAAGAACQPSLDVTLSLGATDSRYLIVPRSDAPNRTPYWVMHMPTSVVPDHSTIFTQVFRDFVIALIQQALLLPPQDRLRAQPLAPAR
jgi:hypothetical protein